MAPDDGGSVAAGGVDTASQRQPVVSGLHDAGPDRNRQDQFLDVQQHHMAVTLSETGEVVPVLFAVAEDDTRFAGQFHQVVGGVAVGGVPLVLDGALEVREEDHVEAVGPGDLTEVAVAVLSRDLHQVQVRVGGPQPLFRGAVEPFQFQSDHTWCFVCQVDLDSGPLGLES